MSNDSGILTNLLNSFESVFTGGYAKLFPDAMHLLSLLAILEVTLASLWWVLAEQDALASFLKKTIQIGFFIFVVSKYQWLIEIILKGFVDTGLKAGGGGSVSLIKNPSAIIDRGFEVTRPAFDYLQNLSTAGMMADLLNVILTGISLLLCILAFFALAIQVFITYLEFFLIAVLGLILVPFGTFKHTAFIAEKVFGAIISFGIRLMVLAFILAASSKTLAGMKLPADPDLKDILVLLLTVLTIMGLSWHAPAIAGGLVSGSPSLTAGAGIGMAAAATAGVAGAGMIGSNAAMSAAGAGAAATKAAAAATGAVATAATMGAAGAGAGAGAITKAAGAMGGVGRMAGATLKDSVSGGVKEAYTRGGMRAASTLRGESPPSLSGSGRGPGSGGGSRPDWARGIQVARQTIPQEVHPGPGMSVPIQQQD